MVGDQQQGRLEIQGPIPTAHGRKEELRVRLPPSSSHARLRPPAALAIPDFASSPPVSLPTPNPHTERSHDQRRHAVRARQLARQPHHDPHRAVPRKSPKPRHTLANASFWSHTLSPRSANPGTQRQRQAQPGVCAQSSCVYLDAQSIYLVRSSIACRSGATCVVVSAPSQELHSTRLCLCR